VWSIIETHPVRNCFAASRLAAGGLDQVNMGGQMWGYFVSDQLRSVLLVGANMVPLNCGSDAQAAFAEYAVLNGRRSSSIVGPAGEVLGLWSRLASRWGPARDVRTDQPLMLATHPAEVVPDPKVRASTLADLDVIFPACVDMFTEEVGVSPLLGGAGPAYRRRVAELIREGRSFARFQDGQPVFKAEIGALSDKACQIQGVWVSPRHRGRGLAAAGMAAVVQQASRLAPAVSLYVNSYNLAAVSAYRRAGFRTIEQFATVLF
jgi:uncharacterized protein